MEFKHHFCVIFASCVLLSFATPTSSQLLPPDFDISIIKAMPFAYKAKLVSGLITSNKAVFQKLEDIALAAFPIIGYDKPPGLLLTEFLPWAIDHLPKLLGNQEFLDVMKIFVTEINNHGKPPSFVIDTNDTSLNRDYFVGKMLSILDYPQMAADILALSILDYPQMAADILALRSVRDFFPYASTTRPLDEQCYNDTMTFVDRLLVGESWAMDMIDAVGKPGAGIKKGLLYFMGNYDQCQAVDAHVQKNDSLGEYESLDDVSFGGRYCRASFGIPESLIQSVAGEHANHTFGIPLWLTWGLCLPTSCHKEDIEGLLNLGVLGSMFNVSLEHVMCTEDQDLPNDKPVQAVIGVLIGLVLLVILSSAIELACLGRKTAARFPTLEGLYEMSKTPHNNLAFLTNGDINGDLYMQDWELKAGLKDEINKEHTNKEQTIKEQTTKEQTTEDPSAPSGVSDKSASTNNVDRLGYEEDTASVKLLRSFSVFTNAPILMSTDTKADDIPSLYGIRFLSMLWVMLGNTYVYTIISVSDAPVAANLMDSFNIMKRFTFQVVMSASYATDTFFMVSGCVTAYWYLSKLEMSTRKINIKSWLKFYLGKYFKLTPPYMLVMGVFVTLYMYLGHGPIWAESLSNAEQCTTDWWKHLLYVNNFVGVDGVITENQCMAWSWYLAVNMQFYLISPILLTFMAFSKSTGLALTGILAVAGIISAGVKESQYGGDLLSAREDGGAYWNNVFTKPWCRVGAYCVGMMLGYVLCKWYHKKMNKFVAAGLWLLSICLAVLVVYCTFSKYADGADEWTRAQQAAYEALGRPVWALCVAWVVYACSSELAGPIGDFLSWKVFVPLSKLTYMVYLIHPVVMVLVVYSRRSLVYVDDFEMAYIFLGHVVVCYGLAFVASLLIDYPFRNIRKTLNGKALESP